MTAEKPKSTKFQIKWLDLAIKIIITLVGVLLLIAHFVDGKSWTKIWSYFATMILPWAPEILELFKIKVSHRLSIAYNVFLVPSMIFGIDLDWYKTVYIFGEPAFDKVSHALSGVLAAFVARELFDNNYDGIEVTADNGKKKRIQDGWFVYLMIISFVGFSAAGWECFEFLYDTFCGGHMQELIAPGVDDTMWDILSALAAGMAAAIPLSFKKRQ